jgi:hypothetical protein
MYLNPHEHFIHSRSGRQTFSSTNILQQGLTHKQLAIVVGTRHVSNNQSFGEYDCIRQGSVKWCLIQPQLSGSAKVAKLQRARGTLLILSCSFLGHCHRLEKMNHNITHLKHTEKSFYFAWIFSLSCTIVTRSVFSCACDSLLPQRA